MVLLDNDAFFRQLTILFYDVRPVGALRICMKKYDGRTKSSRIKKMPKPSEYLCLIRAVTNKRKISTIVYPKDVIKFQLTYCSILRSNMDGLKKVKKAKPKSKASASKNVTNSKL